MRTDIEQKHLYDDLIELSHIFKESYIIKVIDNRILFYPNMNKPYDVKYKTILEIKKDSILFNNGKIPDVCIIKGWFDKQTDTYYIGLEL